jgi:hypothetical protein
MSTPADLLCIMNPFANPAERTAYRRDILNIPGPIDRWLTTNARSPRISFLQDYLMITAIASEYVVCIVEMAQVQRAVSSFQTLVGYLSLMLAQGTLNIYTLYLTAYDTSFLTPSFLRTSPRIVLQRFAGTKDDIDAPEWTSWTSPTLEFQQPRATFAVLFLQMANWEVNRVRVSPNHVSTFV